jgi:hypothetical protein
MKKIVFILILINYQLLADTQSSDIKCLDWSEKHVRPTKHLEYLHFSMVLVDFENFNELKIECENLKFEKIKRLHLKALAPILLPTNIKYANLQTFRFESGVSWVSIRNLKGLLLKKNSKFFYDNEILHLELNVLKFEFYFNETQRVNEETCLKNNFKFINFFDTAYSLMIGQR